MNEHSTRPRIRWGGREIVLGLLAWAFALPFALVALRSPSSASDHSVEGWIRQGARTNQDTALALLKQVDDRGLEALCRVARDDPSWVSRKLEQLRPRLPDAAQSLLPDPKFHAKCVRLALTAIAGHTNWGRHTADVIRAAGNRPPMLSGEGEGHFDYRTHVFLSLHTRMRTQPDAFRDPLLIEALVGALIPALTNRSPWTQYYATAALAKIGPPASNAVPLLKTRYRCTSRTLPPHAAHAVWRITGERLEPLTILLACLTSQNRDTLSWADTHLRAIAPEAGALFPGWQVLENDNPPTRSRPWKGLPAWCGPGGPRVHAILEQLTHGKDPELCEAARRVIRLLEEAGE